MLAGTRVALAAVVSGAMLSTFALCGSGESDEAPAPTNDPAPPPTCSGSSIDPPASELAAAGAFLQQNDYPGGLARLTALSTQYPQSATVRVRAGGAALHGTPHDTATARRFYDEATRLHTSGCTLAPRDHWSLRLGQGLSHMFDGDYQASLEPLRDAATRWPNSSTARYNLACSLCMTGDVTGCERELSAALEVASAGRHTAWESAAPRSVSHYVELSATDSDLAALRATPRYEAVVGPYRN